jgi:O-methyltransferase involved in polyketide biosynthesis
MKFSSGVERETSVDQIWGWILRQVVSLGAGMDSRAFRLGLADMTFFEVDKQALFEVKEPLVSGTPLQAAARHLVVGTIGSK